MYRKPTTVKLTICVDCGIIMEDPAYGTVGCMGKHGVTVKPF